MIDITICLISRLKPDSEDKPDPCVTKKLVEEAKNISKTQKIDSNIIWSFLNLLTMHKITMQSRKLAKIYVCTLLMMLCPQWIKLPCNFNNSSQEKELNFIYVVSCKHISNHQT